MRLHVGEGSATGGGWESEVIAREGDRESIGMFVEKEEQEKVRGRRVLRPCGRDGMLKYELEKAVEGGAVARF